VSPFVILAVFAIVPGRLPERGLTYFPYFSRYVTLLPIFRQNNKLGAKEERPADINYWTLDFQKSSKEESCMKTFRTGYAAILLAWLFVVNSSAISLANSFTIDKGWTLLQTVPVHPTFGGTFIDLPGVGVTPFVGVPLGTFDFTRGTAGDFGRNIGTQFVGTTDSIAKRLEVATVPEGGGTVTIPVELLALQIRSVDPVGGMFGNQFVYVTLQSMRSEGGEATTGTMTIDFNSDGRTGVFSTLFEVYYDFRIGSLDAPPIPQPDKPFAGDNVAWTRDLPTGQPMLIDGVNLNLNGNFFVAGVQLEASDSALHVAIPAQAIPEPSTWVFLATGCVGLLAYGWRRRQRAS
jgi:hypothetical protein